MKMIIGVFCGLLLLMSHVNAEPVVTFPFDNAEQEALFHKLSNELRCLVCQNQSIGDSNAGLAKDLRTEMYEMLKKGKTEDEIIDFMVQRYGDYVLYRPQFKPLTLLLWLGPSIVFFIGVFYAMRFIRRLKQSADAPELSGTDVERLKNLRSQLPSNTKR
jgi:cytochrome c-type biogenesis protein CcmH